MFSALLNAGLDLIFLGLLGFGIVCSAVTTVIAEAVSAGLAAYYMATRERALSPFGSRWKIDGDILASILKYGLPSALQQTIQPVCKVLIQGQVNALGVSSIAASVRRSRPTWLRTGARAEKTGSVRDIGLELHLGLCITLSSAQWGFS